MFIKPQPGWGPIFSPDGQWCAYQGSRVDRPEHPSVRVVNVLSGEEAQLAPVDQEVAAYPCGWLSNERLLYMATSREDRKGPFTLRVIAMPSRYLSTLTLLPHDWLDGVRTVAAKGHWAAACGSTVLVDGLVWSDSLHWRISFDGRLLAVVTEVPGVEPTRYQFELWESARVRSTYPVAPGIAAGDLLLSSECVGYGYGSCRVLDLRSGEDTDAQINPRPQRESAPWVVTGPGGDWVWSFREQPTRLIMGRPFGEKCRCIQVPVPGSCVYLHVMWDAPNLRWLLATNGTRGEVFIQSASDSAALTLLDPPPAVPEYPALESPALVGGFFVGTYRWGGDNGCADVFGNSAVVLGESVAAETLDPCEDGSLRYRIIDPGAIPTMAQAPEIWASVAAIYLAAERSDDPVTAVRKQRQWARWSMDLFGVPRKPCIIYLGTDLDGLARVAGDDTDTWAGVQLYLEPGQGPEDLRALATASLNRLGGLPVCVIAQAYDRNGTYAGDVASLVPVYYEIARGLGARHKATLAFSWKRPGGIVDLVASGRCPDLHQHWLAFARSAPRP